MGRSSESSDQRFARRLELLSSWAMTFQDHPRSTIRPAAKAVLLKEIRDRDGEDLEIEHTIARGGMGVIDQAVQRSLGRKVAVKSLPTEGATDEAARLLLQEAWVTGALEHPNIIPIHLAGVDHADRPYFALKLVEGESWAKLMDDAETVARRFGAKDLFAWNLDVLAQVARGVHFAHTRGIVHRDVKPENVMVGEHGEVYVVDWGLAVAVRDDVHPMIPRLDPEETAGTPAYMAPELLGLPESRVSEKTDIYLLGACLFHLASGYPPHRGTMDDMVRSLFAPPELPDDVPKELAAIIERAMQVDPAARHTSAEAFRLALVEFLAHRGATALSAAAERQLDDLRACLAQRPRDVAKQRQDAHRLFGACRFGFQQSQWAWADNPAARDGLREATLAMIRFELDHASPDTAAALLAELPDAPARWREEVAAAQATAAEDRRRASALRDDADPRLGGRTRVIVGMLVGLCMIVGPGLLDRTLELRRPGSYTNGFLQIGILFLVIGSVAYWGRRAMRRTALNRRGLVLLFAAPLAQLLVQLSGVGLSLTPSDLVVLKIAPLATLAWMAVFLIERRLWPMAIGYGLAFATALTFPERAVIAVTCANVIFTVNVLLAWSPSVVRGGEPTESTNGMDMR